MTQLSVEPFERQLEHILAAPSRQGTVEMIVCRPALGRREVLESAALDSDVGLVGDNWAIRGSSSTPDGSRNPLRQVTVMSARVIDALTAGDRSRWPLAGDQLFVDLDLSPENLPAGTRLEMGEAEIEVTAHPHRGCAKFMDRFGLEGLRFVNTGLGAVSNFRGVNARVIRPGVVATGDAVRRVSNAGAGATGRR